MVYVVVVVKEVQVEYSGVMAVELRMYLHHKNSTRMLVSPNLNKMNIGIAYCTKTKHFLPRSFCNRMDNIQMVLI